MPSFQNFFRLGLLLSWCDSSGRGLELLLSFFILLNEVLCIIVWLRGGYVISVAQWCRCMGELWSERPAVNGFALGWACQRAGKLDRSRTVYWFPSKLLLELLVLKVLRAECSWVCCCCKGCGRAWGLDEWLDKLLQLYRRRGCEYTI